MSFASLDTYTQLQSPIHRWNPRWKIISLLGLMFAFASVQQRSLLLPMLGITVLLYGLSQLPLTFLIQRLRYPGLFILAVVIVLPLASGDTVLWQWGWLTLRQEGVEAMTLILCRFLSILTIGFILLGTTSFLVIIKAMRSLGLPTILTDMTLLSYRYLYEIADTLATMQQSMRLRGFGHRRQRWLRLDWPMLGQLATLTGTLLIRSYERSERIYKAMRLRGYGAKASTASQTYHQPLDTVSLVLTAVILCIAIAFLVAEVVLSAS